MFTHTYMRLLISVFYSVYFFTIGRVSSTFISPGHVSLNASDSHIALSGDFPLALISGSLDADSASHTVLTTVSIDCGEEKTNQPVCHGHLHWPELSKPLHFHLPCSCFIWPGIYTISIYWADARWNASVSPLASKAVNVSRPQFTLQLPSRYSLSSGQPISLLFERLQNDSLCQVNDYPWHDFDTHGAQGAVLGVDSANTSGNYSLPDHWRVAQLDIPVSHLTIWRALDQNQDWKRVGWMAIQNWTALVNSNSTLPLPCALFALPGAYRVELASGGIAIGESDIMRVVDDPSDDYELKVVAHFVYPCPAENGLPVTYSLPRSLGCLQSIDYEAIRLYASQPRKEEIRGGLSRGGYVSEEILPPRDASVPSARGVAYFSCNRFDLIYPQHCFQLATVYKDGTVIERATQCVQTQNTKYSPVHGEWSKWQAWGPCTVSCGEGVQHRIRYCDNPRPADGGEYCAGNGMETRSCSSLSICPASPPSVQPPVQMSDCACGCNLTRVEGGLVPIYRHVPCPINPTVWTISAPSPVHRIQMRIQLANTLDNPESEWLRIWEADNSWYLHTLLFDSSIAPRDDRWVPIQTRAGIAVLQHFGNDSVADPLLGALVRYRFATPTDPTRREKSWWGRLRSDRRLSIAFTALAAVTGFLFLALLYSVSWQYTVKRLRSKRCYLLRGNSNQSGVCSDGQASVGGRWREMVAVAPPSDHKRPRKTSQEALLGKYPRPFGESNSPGLTSTFRPRDDAMQASTRTEETRLSVMTRSTCSASPQQPPGACSAKSVRSIGIQLSSPILATLRSRTSERCPNGRKWQATNSGVDQATRPDSPNLSVCGTEQDDFEYDYYDAPVPGSVFSYQPRPGFETDIDIEDIIERSHLMKPVQDAPPAVATVSVSTQSQPVSLEAGGSADSSEWSFKWTKPTPAMTQFHFL